MPTPFDPGPSSGYSPPRSGWAGWVTAGAALLALAVVVVRRPVTATAAPAAQPAPVQSAVPPAPAASAVLPNRGNAVESRLELAPWGPGSIGPPCGALAAVRSQAT